MRTIVFEHISGEKANQRETFSNDAPLLIGRDLSAQLQFSDRADMVSRRHAQLKADPAQPYGLLLK